MHAVDELSERSVEMRGRRRQLRRVRAEVVAGVVDFLEVQADERRPLALRAAPATSSACATRSAFGSFSSNGFQYVGRTPPIAASLPGQNIVAARRPWRIAVDPDRLAAPPARVLRRRRRHA